MTLLLPGDLSVQVDSMSDRQPQPLSLRAALRCARFLNYGLPSVLLEQSHAASA